jgi:hypothetical protein
MSIRVLEGSEVSLKVSHNFLINIYKYINMKKVKRRQVFKYIHRWIAAEGDPGENLGFDNSTGKGRDKAAAEAFPEF